MQRYPESQEPYVVKERERNAVAMEEYINKIKEYSKDDRNGMFIPLSRYASCFEKQRSCFGPHPWLTMNADPVQSGW